MSLDEWRAQQETQGIQGKRRFVQTQNGEDRVDKRIVRQRLPYRDTEGQGRGSVPVAQVAGRQHVLENITDAGTQFAQVRRNDSDTDPILFFNTPASPDRSRPDFLVCAGEIQHLCGYIAVLLPAFMHGNAGILQFLQ